MELAVMLDDRLDAISPLNIDSERTSTRAGIGRAQIPEVDSMTAASASAKKFWRRAYAGFGPGAVAIAFAFAVCDAFTFHFSWVLVPYRDEWYGRWFALEFASFFLVAAVAALILFPTLNFAPKRTVLRGLVLLWMVGLTAVILALVRIASMSSMVNYFETAHLLDRYIPRIVAQFFLFGLIAVGAAELFRHETADIEAAHQADLDRANLEGELVAARLQVLRAQIEPHFLFNTLATVRRLYDIEPAAGRAMLTNLMRYLEIALPHMKVAMSALQDEFNVTRAFLNVQKVRMGERLSFAIDFPQDLASIAFPPMMVLTLVENAIKHGLAPLRSGGTVQVTARREQDQRRLVVTVSDTGRGFGASDSQGTGTGIANLQARLTAMYGGVASIAFRSAVPQGVIATLTIPITDPSGFSRS